MKKLMTFKWFRDLFVEETQKQFPDVISIKYIWDSYIVERDILKEGETITEKNLEKSWFGLKVKSEEIGYTFKEYKLIFKYDIHIKDNNYREPTLYNVYLNLNKILTCDKAATLEKSIRDRLEKEEISDTVRFTYIKDSVEETLTVKEDSFRRIKSVN